MLVKNITINGLNKIINEKLCKLKAVNSLLEVQYDLKAKLFACYHRSIGEILKCIKEVAQFWQRTSSNS